MEEQITIFESISRALFKTPSQTTQNIIIIVAALFIIPLLSAIYRSVSKKQIIKTWQKEFHRLIRKKNLTINEVDLLNELAIFLVEPRRKALLFENLNTLRICLARWEKREGHPAEYGQSLVEKLFGKVDAEPQLNLEKPFGINRPAHFIASDGTVFAGKITIREKGMVTLEQFRVVKQGHQKGEGRLFIQDSHGIASYPVLETKRLNPDSIVLKISPDKSSKQGILPSVFIYPENSTSAVETRLRLLQGRLAIVDNPDGFLKSGHAVKVAFRTDMNKRYLANAMVTGLSLNKTKAKLRFGYLKTLPKV